MRWSLANVALCAASALQDATCDTTSSLQIARIFHSGGSNETTCAKLSNMGSYFTIPVDVGTPGETFNLVADTGSSSVIVAACECQNCVPGHCFAANGSMSSSFSMAQMGHASEPPMVEISFGSGQVWSYVSSDVVGVGDLSATMDNGLLLIMLQRLDIAGGLEGIFGIGLPEEAAKRHKQKEIQERLQRLAEQRMQELMSNVTLADNMMSADAAATASGAALQDAMLHTQVGVGPDGKASTMAVEQSIASGESLMQVSASGTELQQLSAEEKSAVGSQGGMWPFGPMKKAWDKATGSGEGEPDDLQYDDRSFMSSAGVDRFDLCFGGDDEGNGEIRLNFPQAPQLLGNYGAMHWALAMSSILVNGSAPEDVAGAALCSDEAQDRGLTMNCGAIPDSGTTLIMAPQRHIDALLDKVCLEWSRCHNNFTVFEQTRQAAINSTSQMYGAKDPFDLADFPSRPAEVLRFLLSDCDSWLEEDGDRHLNRELPNVSFLLNGSDGSSQTISFRPEHYVWETMLNATAFSNESLDEYAEANDEPMPNRICDVAFGAIAYETEMNGPVWILGTPLFYAYRVGFDVENLAMSFEEGAECGTCSEHPKEPSALVSETSQMYPRDGSGSSSGLRRVSGKPRLPSFQPSKRTL